MALKSLPSLREKKRYIVFRLHSEGKLSYAIVKNAIFDSLLEFLGEQEFARANIRFIKNLWNQKTGFLETTPAYVDKVKVGLALIHQIGEEKVIFQTLKVSGTIKSGKKAL